MRELELRDGTFNVRWAGPGHPVEVMHPQSGVWVSVEGYDSVARSWDDVPALAGNVVAGFVWARHRLADFDDTSRFTRQRDVVLEGISTGGLVNEYFEAGTRMTYQVAPNIGRYRFTMPLGTAFTAFYELAPNT